MAHRWMDESLPVYPGTVKEGYLVKSPPLDKRGVKVGIYIYAGPGRSAPAPPRDAGRSGTWYTNCGCVIEISVYGTRCGLPHQKWTPKIFFYLARPVLSSYIIMQYYSHKSALHMLINNV